MPETLTALPARRSDLLVRPFGDKGEAVIKDPRSGEYFNLGQEESFLLDCLDGAATIEGVRLKYRERFGADLSEEDLAAFVELAQSLGFLRDQSTATPTAPVEERPARKKARQSILYWRKSAFDPDRLFNWLEPKIRFVWTRAFFVASAALIGVAFVMSWQNSDELISRFPYVFEWETWALAWLTLTLVTTCHEFAHGLTCKHYGGEVHEVGFLLMFFIPCFYCNVSDAWLFRERSKRLWVTFAGAHCDLICWAVAVLVWRVTLQESLLNYLAWVVMSVCGFRVFFNFNPLLKLDGYYLLSDMVGIPNLRQESTESVARRLRWLLWGAPRPRRQSSGLFLIVFGLLTWLYGFVFLTLMFLALVHYAKAAWGIAGAATAAGLGVVVMKGMFRGLSSGEVRTMLSTRKTRTMVWVAVATLLLTGVLVVPIERHAKGSFELRPRRRVELRAPIAGFLRTVEVDEGSPVAADAVVAVIDVPDLASRIAQKRAELAEAESKLRLLKAGPRYEELVEMRQRVDRAKHWHELAERDLARAVKAFEADMTHCDEMIRQHEIEVRYAAESFQRAQEMMATQALSQQEYRDWQRRHDVAQATLAQQRSLKQARLALGTSEAEGEVAKRAKELADAKSALALLELGARPEEIAAQEAVVLRIEEELHHLEGLRGKLNVRPGLEGVVVTPRPKELVGQYLKEGDLICIVEECGALEAEVTLKEQELVHVQAGQEVELKARGVPYHVYRSQVSRIAPRATKGEVQSTVALYCRVEDKSDQLKPGMTGYAQVLCGKQPIARVVSDRVLRSIRTEFWW